MLAATAPNDPARRERAARRRRLATLIGILLALANAAPAEVTPDQPQEPREEAEWLDDDEPEAPAAGPSDPLERGVPRGTVRGFLVAARAGDYARASRYLDLRQVPTEAREIEGPALARQLKVVLDRKVWVDLDALSDQPEGVQEDGLPRHRDRVGTIRTEEGAVDVFVDRVRRADGVPIWKFSSATVARVPALYEKFGYGPLGELLPAPLFELQLLEIQLWQWIGMLVLILVAFALSWYLARLALRFSSGLAARTDTEFDERLLEVLAGPLRLLIAIALFSAATPLLGLALPAERFVRGLEKALVVVAIALVVFRLVDVFCEWAAHRLVAQEQTAAAAAVPMGRRVVKVIVAGFAGLALLHNFGVNVTAVVAGLGVGGLAVALAAQKTIENLFGGVSVIVDQPVRVGDFCRFGDQVGTVEDVGLRSTRVRTLDRTVVSIPNAEFSQMRLENFAKRDRMRIYATLGLRYETTPDQLRFVLVAIRRLLYAHPKISPDPARVRFVGFGAYSLDLELFAYVLTADWNEFLAVREDVYLRLIDIVDASGTGFAFPSQTTYLEKGEGVDRERGREAEQQVEAWREEGQLCLPHFPAETIAELDDSLEYPPRGSAWREPAPEA